MLILILLAAIVAVAVKFAIADGDFTLLSKRPAKREDFDGKVVWITGASKGIGRVLAKQFASLGAKLILSARNVAELEQVKAELIGRYSACEVEVLPLDLSSGEETLQEAVQTAESCFSGAGVDFMVHNAGGGPQPMSALKITQETLLATFKTNVFGTITITQLLAPSMLKRGKGHFIVMSSTAGKCPAPGEAAYSASKFALNGYFQTLRSELCQKGIKVTVVCPGPIDTLKDFPLDDSDKPVPVERCVQLIITAASHGLKEVWIAKQPILLAMYLLQYMPTIGYWLMDKVGGERLETLASPANSMASSEKNKTI